MDIYKVLYPPDHGFLKEKSEQQLQKVGRFDVNRGATLNEVVYFTTGLPDGSYELFVKVKQ